VGLKDVLTKPSIIMTLMENNLTRSPI